MAWRGPFLDALAQRARAPVYVLEVVTVYDEPGKPYSVGSESGLGSSSRVFIGGARGRERVRVEGATLTPRAWSTTIGAFSVGIVGDLGEFCAHVTRGTILALKVGFVGMEPADFETVALGQFRNVRGVSPAYTVECHDLPTALRQRLTTDYATASLFYGITSSTTVAASWSPATTTLTVGSTAGFERETGGTGAVKVTPSGDDPFYLSYSGTTSGTFTGLDTSAILGTVEVAVAGGVGIAVEEVLYLSGHPIDIARKVLCSRDGTNGVYDTLPTSAGLGLLSALVDHDDADRYRDDVVTVSSGSYAWQMAIEGEQEDGFAWLSGMLARGGMFLTVRQGLLTVRAAQDTQSAAYVTGIEITDADVARVVSYEAYDYRHSPEYARVDIQTGSGGDTSVSETLATLPARGSLLYDLSDRVYVNETNIQEDAIGRLHESAARVPERLVLACAGLRLAQLAPGDVVDLTLTRTQSRRDGAAGWSSRRALVDSVSPSWDAGTVEVGLLVYPESEDAFA